MSKLQILGSETTLISSLPHLNVRCSSNLRESKEEEVRGKEGKKYFVDVLFMIVDVLFMAKEIRYGNRTD